MPPFEPISGSAFLPLPRQPLSYGGQVGHAVYMDDPRSYRVQRLYAHWVKGVASFGTP